MEGVASSIPTGRDRTLHYALQNSTLQCVMHMIVIELYISRAVLFWVFLHTNFIYIFGLPAFTSFKNSISLHQIYHFTKHICYLRLIGSISCSSYPYFGLQSNNSQLYLRSVEATTDCHLRQGIHV